MARNTAATDAGVGAASITTKIKLTVQAVQKSFLFGGLPLFVLPLIMWLIFVSPAAFDMVKVHAVSVLVSSELPRKWRLRDTDGSRKVLTVFDSNSNPVQFLTPAQFRKIVEPNAGAVTVLRNTFLGSILAGIIGFYLVWRKFTASGKAQQTNRRIRGSQELVDAKSLDVLVRKEGPSDYKLVDVSLPRDAPMRGILAIGAQGSGKSLALHDLMQQVFKKKTRKSIIYDQSGEFYRAYFRPGKDYFFNPACVGSVPWSIFSEMEYTYDANTLAQAFLPTKAGTGQVGPNTFFEDAARALFSVILLRLTERGAEDTRDIARAFLEMPADEMSRLIQKSIASSAIAGDSKGQRQGVISSISIYLDGIASVGPGKWSISDFLKGDDDARLFIVGTEDTKAMFAPLYRLILAVAFSSIAARQEIVHEDRYWFFLDEIHTLGDIRVDEQLSTLRKFGVCVVAGTQNDTQFNTALGKDRAASAMNGFNTLLQLRMNEAEAKERAATRLGKNEMETVSQNQAVAVVERRDGAGIVINEQEKWLVMPSTIGELATCTGYLKMAGAFPAAALDYRNWLPRRRGKRSRVDRFKEVQGSPPRDPKFKIEKRVLPGGESPFDGVRREVEIERAAEAEQAREAEENKKNEAVPSIDAPLTDASTVLVDLAMTSLAPTSTEPRDAPPGTQQIDLGL